MAISREQVEHVARLSRLALSEEELERFGEQLGAILEAVGKVSELDLSDVEPTAHPLDLVNVFGEDEPHESLPAEEGLALAPDPEGGFYGVPARGA
jgi:aspartyl-tRNA(Asn)/glutamyl-tRNA(Gln) amidotransferase subunit C